MKATPKPPATPVAKTPASADRATDNSPEQTDPSSREPAEIGGRDGPDPTRYGDWEKNGRCIDF
ncbi:MAG: DUF1674 domain-containing protein [Pseudomonadota bacterium]